MTTRHRGSAALLFCASLLASGIAHAQGDGFQTVRPRSPAPGAAPARAPADAPPAAAPAAPAAPGVCQTRPFYGAGSYQGARTTMTVSNSGRPCAIVLGNPPASLTVTEPPAHGRAQVVGANRFTYVPAPGFVGSDRFTVSGTPAPWRVEVSITVVAPGPGP